MLAFPQEKISHYTTRDTTNTKIEKYINYNYLATWNPSQCWLYAYYLVKWFAISLPILVTIVIIEYKKIEKQIYNMETMQSNIMSTLEATHNIGISYRGRNRLSKFW